MATSQFGGNAHRPELSGAQGGPVAAVADRDGTQALLRFLSRLSRFGLAAGMEPLLKPSKPGS